LVGAYARWRRSRLGRVTDDLEFAAIGAVAGDLAGLRVLDAGCGDGNFDARMAAAGGRVVGLDRDLRALAAAARGASALPAGLAFVGGDIERLPFADEAFDVVVAVAVLCLVRDPHAAVAELCRVLKPNGRLIVGELGRHSLWNALRRVRGRLGHPLWRAAHFWTREELFSLLAVHGLQPQAARGAVYYPPIGALAAAFRSGPDPWLGARTTFGAAFIVVAAAKAALPATGHRAKAATPGSVLPSMNSRNAPPAVET
jgi:SAM-dependent methyltransferase